MHNPFEELNTRLDRIESLLSGNNTQAESNNLLVVSERPITTAQLCEFFDITEPTVIRLRKRGKIPFLQIGGSIRYDKNAVVKALEKNRSP